MKHSKKLWLRRPSESQVTSSLFALSSYIERISSSPVADSQQPAFSREARTNEKEDRVATFLSALLIFKLHGDITFTSKQSVLVLPNVVLQYSTAPAVNETQTVTAVSFLFRLSTTAHWQTVGFVILLPAPWVERKKVNISKKLCRAYVWTLQGPVYSKIVEFVIIDDRDEARRPHYFFSQREVTLKKYSSYGFWSLLLNVAVAFTRKLERNRKLYSKCLQIHVHELFTKDWLFSQVWKKFAASNICADKAGSTLRLDITGGKNTPSTSEWWSLSHDWQWRSVTDWIQSLVKSRNIGALPTYRFSDMKRYTCY